MNLHKYEQEKQKLKNLPSKQYEEEIIKLTKRLGI
jgi:hypothetical protein